LAQVAKSVSEWTHLGAVDPFPYSDGAEAKIQIGPMSKDSSTLGVDIRITNSPEKGQSRQLGPEHIHMVISR
jgi:hypothetical protein